MTEKQILFVMGVGRSGTTAMANLLNGHPDICIGIERYKFKFVRRAEFDGNEFEAGRFFPIRKTDTNIVPGLSRKWRRLYVRMKRKFDAAPIVGDKIPHLFQTYDACARAFPRAKWIYMLRRIEGVASSWNARAQDPKDKWPAQKDYRAAVQTWNAANTIVRERMGPHLHVVAYEDFFGGDQGAYARFVDFLGIDTPPVFAKKSAAIFRKYAESVRTKTPLVLDGQAEHIAANADLATYHELIRAAQGKTWSKAGS